MVPITAHQLYSLQPPSNLILQYNTFYHLFHILRRVLPRPEPMYHVPFPLEHPSVMAGDTITPMRYLALISSAIDMKGRSR